MIFSSVPVYLDPPNWQQPPDDHPLRNENLHEIASFPEPHRPLSSLTRPGSIADRARLAKIPQPEVQLKCPRCESSNTKFCYYNNYNLSQPRHFCKTCRRYWTQGGALRNVPVGGGCRKNKKNKSKTSKSSTERPCTSNLSSGSIPSGNNTREMINHFQQNPNQFPIIPSLPSFTRYGVGTLGGPSHFNEIQLHNEIGVDHQWRPQQFPFLGGFESTGLYPYQNDSIEAPSSAAEALHLHEATLNNRATEFPPVKNEEIQMLNLTRGSSSVGVLNNSQIYGANAWTDLSGLSSSATNRFF